MLQKLILKVTKFQLRPRKCLSTVVKNIMAPMSNRVKTFLKRGNFVGATNGGRGKIFRSMKMLVFAKMVVFLTFLGLGAKFSRWSKTL